MSPVDPYAMTDNLDDTLIQVIVTRVEARGTHPIFARMLQDYLDAMRIDTARTVLDMAPEPESPLERSRVDEGLPAWSRVLT